jgi:hypothetical protein
MVLGEAQPGARLLRENVVVIFVVIFIGVFLSYMDTLQDDIEVVAVEKTLNEINSALALTLYQHAIEGRLNDLSLLDGENPFIYLAIHHQLPVNYAGSFRSDSEPEGSHIWYYNLDTKVVVYRSGRERRLFELSFQYADVNKNRQFEASVDKIKQLRLIQKMSPAKY